VAHDVAPFGAVDIAMAIGKWRHVRVDVEIVTCSDNVANLVRDRVGRGGTLVVHHSKRFFLLSEHPRSQSAPRGIIDDQHADIGAVLVTQTMYFVHVTVALIGKAPDVLKMLGALLDVVRLVGVHKPELDVPEIAYPE